MTEMEGRGQSLEWRRSGMIMFHVQGRRSPVYDATAAIAEYPGLQDGFGKDVG
jgi:hypothetical protein